ncbi:MAG: ubiquinol oxidase subunit II [Aestuariivirga sp.]
MMAASARVLHCAGKAVLALVCISQLSGCSDQRPPVLYPDGPVALATRDLLLIAVGLMFIVVIPVFVLTAFVIWRYRASDPKGRYTPDWGFSWPIDIVVWAVPIAIVTILGLLVWIKTHELDPYRAVAAPGAPIVVEVVALDWKWLFIYPEQNIASVNRLVFPAGRGLMLKITSDTVMNAFVVPALGGQIYAMAGMQTQLNLLADAPGTFEGHNTQFSGKGFSQDRFTAEATTQQGFDNFVSNARTAGERLDAQTYDVLAQPTTSSPQRVYSDVDPNLFSNIIVKYIDHVQLPERSPNIAPLP